MSETAVIGNIIARDCSVGVQAVALRNPVKGF
jgi:hypothetical protein